MGAGDRKLGPVLEKSLDRFGFEANRRRELGEGLWTDSLGTLKETFEGFEGERSD